MNENEAVAAIKILGAVAQADGRVHPEEIAALRQATLDWQGPGETKQIDVAALLTQPIDLAAELQRVTTPVARRAVLESAIAMSLADGSASDAENKALGLIREAFAGSQGGSLLETTLRKRGTAPYGAVHAILDPAEREEAVSRLIRTKAAFALLIGVMPVPFLSGALVYLVWLDTIDGIAALWGHQLTRAERVARFGGLVAIGVAGASVQSLLHLLPVMGSVVHGMVSYVTTMALGYAVNRSFASEGKLSKEELQKAFAEGKVLGKKAYEEDKAKLTSAAAEHEAEIRALSKKLEANEITIEEYEEQLSKIMNK
jgi:uncharacterized protein (DUF697 family)/uncharacterized tellurite resistance protein B-like protein